MVGCIWSDLNKSNSDNGSMRAHIESDTNSDSTMPSLQSVSDVGYYTEDSTDSEDSVDSERIRRRQALKAKTSKSASYRVSQLAPLSTSPAWDEINAQLNIPLRGPESLRGLCDEAHFARSRLRKTLSALLNDYTQAEAALFCLEQITD